MRKPCRKAGREAAANQAHNGLDIGLDDQARPLAPEVTPTVDALPNPSVRTMRVDSAGSQNMLPVDPRHGPHPVQVIHSSPLCKPVA